MSKWEEGAKPGCLGRGPEGIPMVKTKTARPVA